MDIDAFSIETDRIIIDTDAIIVETGAIIIDTDGLSVETDANIGVQRLLALVESMNFPPNFISNGFACLFHLRERNLFSLREKICLSGTKTL